MTKKITMTEDDYFDHREGFDGYCLSCNGWTAFGGVEPDARSYECPVCEKPRVFGAEEMLMIGILEINGDRVLDGDGDMDGNYPD